MKKRELDTLTLTAFLFFLNCKRHHCTTQLPPPWRKEASCLGAAAKRQHGHVLFQGPGEGVSRSLISVGATFPQNDGAAGAMWAGNNTSLLPPLFSAHILTPCSLPLHAHPRGVKQTCREITPRVFKVFQPQRNSTLCLSTWR